MCETCVKYISSFPAQGLADMEEMRSEIEALAEKIGPKLNGSVINCHMNNDPVTEEDKLIADRLPSHINMLSLALLTGYITGHKNHDAIMVRELEEIYMVGSNLGWAKAHLDSMPKN